MFGNMKYPFISAKCITYGRVDTLEELIYSFLNQDYEGWSELIIVNDYPLQTLIFDHPKVKIFNLKETFSTIGAKENFAIELDEQILLIDFSESKSHVLALLENNYDELNKDDAEA